MPHPGSLSKVHTGFDLPVAKLRNWRVADAEFLLGHMHEGYLYEHGKGVPLDYSVAYMWYKAAADRGVKPAGAQLRKLSELLTPAQVKQAGDAAAKITGSLPQTDLGSGVTSVSGLFPRR